MLLLVAVGGVFLFHDGGGEVPPSARPAPGSGSGSERNDAVEGLLSRLQAGLTDGRRREVLALAASGNEEAATSLGTIYDNAHALGLTDLSLHLVDGNLPRAGAGIWAADVQVSWRIPGYDANPSRMQVPFAFARTRAGARVVSVGGHLDDSAVPLWLATDLVVTRSRRALVMVAGGGGGRSYSLLADRATADVGRVLIDWRGKLVVEVPGSQEELERVIGAEDNTYQAIAAITSTAGGSLEPSSPAHILVNPTVFGRLGRDGAQIVMSHEATHVATAAATSTMPMWLLEGFADYVAFASVNLPVSVTAGQIMAEVRRSGPPARLPGPKEFDPTNEALGSTYEAAWLACRFLAKRYGEPALSDFYVAVDRGTTVQTAFERLLGTSRREFTSQWQAYLRRLAT